MLSVCVFFLIFFGFLLLLFLLISHPPSLLFFLAFLGAITVDGVFLFCTLPSFNCFFCALPARGAVCSRPTAPLAHPPTRS
ncbi:hypothetical protein TCDM_13472 [Trypanosoma cruzi Dm28c]|uniref:Uncharacterized protein n=1 Tax=Trypanosoma cruzi Dm28c TaxID=1416333 RepID=V5CIA4_TRYCR|nr:hypothetical protein TCDM_13472 [Trypanosoma cruzi Dm28c]